MFLTFLKGVGLALETDAPFLSNKSLTGQKVFNSAYTLLTPGSPNLKDYTEKSEIELFSPLLPPVFNSAKSACFSNTRLACQYSLKMTLFFLPETQTDGF